MSEFDQLSLLAEVSAGLLGFVAVFLALSRGDGRFTPSDRHFVQALVINSAYVLICALTPGVLVHFQLSGIWLPALIVAATGGGIVSALMAWEQHNIPEDEYRTINRWWHVPAWGLAAFGTLLTVLGFIQPQLASAYYVAGVSVVLLISVWCFIALVFRRFF